MTCGRDGHPRKGWDRIAVVTDEGWVEKAVHAFAWVIPGEVRAFPDGALDDATDWITEGLG